MSKIHEAAERIAEGYEKIEGAVVGGYKMVEDTVVGSFTRVADRFVDAFLTRDGETPDQAKARLAEEQGEILVITTAVFAFYKFTRSFLDIARDRKHIHPVDSSIRMLDLAQASFAIFSLQASMFHTFGTGEGWEQLLNTITGCAVCLLIVSMGIYMIRRANREIKQLQEKHHGTFPTL